MSTRFLHILLTAIDDSSHIRTSMLDKSFLERLSSQRQPQQMNIFCLAFEADRIEAQTVELLNNETPGYRTSQVGD